eukprot:9031698-Pyramimonas_sp.AAC.1
MPVSVQWGFSNLIRTTLTQARAITSSILASRLCPRPPNSYDQQHFCQPPSLRKGLKLGQLFAKAVVAEAPIQFHCRR